MNSDNVTCQCSCDARLSELEQTVNNLTNTFSSAMSGLDTLGLETLLTKFRLESLMIDYSSFTDATVISLSRAVSTEDFSLEDLNEVYKAASVARDENQNKLLKALQEIQDKILEAANQGALSNES